MKASSRIARRDPGARLCLALFGLVAMSATARAAVIEVTDRGSQSANDTISWASLGASGTVENDPFTINSATGNSTTVSMPSGQFQRNDQGNTWGGNFAPGDALIWTDNHPGPLTLTFGSLVLGGGVQIEDNQYGSFTATVAAYDASHNLLASFTENGSSSPAGDNSAIYIGVLSSTANIDSIVFNVTSPTNVDFAVNTVSLDGVPGNPAVPVPEPASLALLGLGGLGLLAALRRRRIATA